MSERLPIEAVQFWQLDNAPNDLLGTNPKVEKGTKAGILTAILHLAPSTLASVEDRAINTCVFASAGCRAACLNGAGHGGIFKASDRYGLNAVTAARVRRTRYFYRDHPAFMAQLVREIARHEKRAKKAKLIAAVRLNGTSDLRWETFPCERDGTTYPHVFAAFPEITFYDYTKWPLHLRDVADIPNYSLTFSLSESNDAVAASALATGANVAVAFDRKPGTKNRPGEALPETFTIGNTTYPVIDGDVTDARFTDEQNVIVGLRAKRTAGIGEGRETGFIRSA